MRALEPLGADDPTEVGSYRLLGLLGHGGMGRVYLGRSRGGRLVAVKVVHRHLTADERFRSRFANEVAAVRLVSGARERSYTAAVLAADPDAEVPWVATGFVAGIDLTHVVEEYGPLPHRTVRALGAGLAEALSAVHAHDLVHRDVKPSNVLLALDGPCLIDFGIARAAEASTRLTSTGVAVGSPGFMAPEQVTGEAATGPATDVFALGAVLAYAAGGRQPFPGDNAAQLLYRIVHTEPRLDAVVPDSLRELVAACLAKDPAARPGPAEVVRALAGERGAGALLAGSSGWLPEAVATGIGRRAVQLLQLESEPFTPEPLARGPVASYSPTAVDPGPASDSASGPDAATVTAIVRPEPADEESPAPGPTASTKPEAPQAPPWKRALGAAGVVVLLAAVGFGMWNDHRGSDRPVALPAPFVGRWDDSRDGYGNVLELRAGRVGDEVGVLTADTDGQDGSATCRYRLRLTRTQTDGFYADLAGAPVSGGPAACDAPLKMSLQTQRVKGPDGEDVLAFLAHAPVTSLNVLFRAG
ncbi:protein kinase [Streptomyces sp. NPDC088785]|uniref:serine/threonine-protein kinase n=1 Tax=Streptomyces sp. NPDC088785 TaxID=3365897 RepID=UPI00382F9E09